MNTTDHVPRWRRIADELRDRIRAGRYVDGFPGELEIAAEFSVSRGTVRAALRPLRDSGLISAARGRRSQITQSEPGSQYGAIYSLHELITASGMQHHSTVLEQRLTVDATAASKLGLAPGEDLFHLARVRHADGQPVGYDEIFSPASIAAPLLHVDFTDAPFYRELRERGGVTVHGGTEEIQAMPAGEALAELLLCDPQASLLLLERTAWADGQTVEYRRSHFLGDRFRLARPFGPLDENGPASPNLL